MGRNKKNRNRKKGSGWIAFDELAYWPANRSGKTNSQLADFLHKLNVPQWRIDEILEGKIDND